MRALAPLVQPTSAVSAGIIHLHTNNKQLLPHSRAWGVCPAPYPTRAPLRRAHHDGSEHRAGLFIWKTVGVGWGQGRQWHASGWAGA